jgi:nitrate/TMAO reductase-like tetraheme cytochrome c subunit
MKKVFGINKLLLIGLVAGGIGGILVALAAEKVDHLTSTDEFCTSCHSMSAYIADSETYKTSTHRTHVAGVQPGCASCHIPKGLVPATYTHVVEGVKDIIAQMVHDYEDPKVWEQERARLAYSVRDKMRASDSVTCRSCHIESLIQPTRKRGQKQHLLAKENGMTCIDCHYNLVHDEVEPRNSFLDSAGLKD